MRVESPVRPGREAAGFKDFFAGTHRAGPPEQTWARVHPLFGAAGITRVGDVTRLDSVGIPVAQAVRPTSRSLAVTLGAGLTPISARLSAAMAALELWHAEHVETPPAWSAVGAVRANLGYNPFALPLHTPHLLNDGTVLDWVPATHLLTGRSTVVPRVIAEYDLALREEWSPPALAQSRVGIAAGNTYPEAVLHALYEVLAHDAIAASAAPGLPRADVDMSTIDSDDARRLLDRLVAAGLHLRVSDLSGAAGVPTFAVIAESTTPRVVARGAACHLDRNVALCRALSAAARERLALITGVRDDLPVIANAAAAVSAGDHADTARLRDYRDIPSRSTSSFAGDIAELSDRLHREGAGPVLVVDLTRQAVGLPVARVVVPGLPPRGGD